MSQNTHTIPSREEILGIFRSAKAPLDLLAVAKSLKETKHVSYVLYGGSVTSANVSQFTKMEHIDGVLVGGASLDPEEFSRIVQYA